MFEGVIALTWFRDSAEFGEIMSRFYISHETFLAIKTLPVKSGMRALLETLSNATEMSSYRFRQGEKSVRLCWHETPVSSMGR